MFVQKDFDIDEVPHKPLMAHLSTVEKGEPRDSRAWFLWEDSCLWIFGTSEDGFVKRLRTEPKCAAGIVEYDLGKGILKHVGIRGIASLASCDKDRLMRFVAKYLGEDKQDWNPWLVANIVDPLDAMIKIVPQSILAKNVSFLRRDRILLPRNCLWEKKEIVVVGRSWSFWKGLQTESKGRYASSFRMQFFYSPPLERLEFLHRLTVLNGIFTII
ncbi:hypothetical protein [Parachlamydia sp. AcF125]|uniref:hypothetical protein n=1 Tax=Parachlamydia sp. AcF125 TaxID=2795736 RepID=UPI001BCA2102|nr:hypothetical protein [Parachlamydia sp. AcF125]MBS4168982.1 hypothetical protein [Parachlamydia sp. AcF125]